MSDEWVRSLAGFGFMLYLVCRFLGIDVQIDQGHWLIAAIAIVVLWNVFPSAVVFEGLLTSGGCLLLLFVVLGLMSGVVFALVMYVGGR